MKIEIDENGCNFVEIDCNENFPLNIAFNCYKEIKKYLGSRIKNIEEIGGGINAEEVLYKIIAREGTISIYADWAGVDVRAENIDSNTLLYELYNNINKKGIIFDLDGTLWDASTQVVPAWNIALNRHSELDKQITIDDMRGFMGKTIHVIAEIMFPGMDSEKSVKILTECCNEEQIYLRKHGGILYPKLEDTLKLLAQKYSLYIVSNCQDGYVQAFLDYHKLWSYFKDIEMSGRTGKSKGENIKIIIERNELKKSVYVGDTTGDLEGANYAGIPFIYAEYGFGQLDDVEYSINNISDINRIIGNIL